MPWSIFILQLKKYFPWILILKVMFYWEPKKWGWGWVLFKSSVRHFIFLNPVFIRVRRAPRFSACRKMIKWEVRKTKARVTTGEARGSHGDLSVWLNASSPVEFLICIMSYKTTQPIVLLINQSCLHHLMPGFYNAEIIIHLSIGRVTLIESNCMWTVRCQLLSKTIGQRHYWIPMRIRKKKPFDLWLRVFYLIIFYISHIFYKVIFRWQAIWLLHSWCYCLDRLWNQNWFPERPQWYICTDGCKGVGRKIIFTLSHFSLYVYFLFISYIFNFMIFFFCLNVVIDETLLKLISCGLDFHIFSLRMYYTAVIKMSTYGKL